MIKLHCENCVEWDTKFPYENFIFHFPCEKGMSSILVRKQLTGCHFLIFR